MALVSIPTYNTVFRYRGELKSNEFNRLFSKTVPAGIYEGGVLTRLTDTRFEVDSLSIIIENSNGNDIAVRVRLPEPFQWDVETGNLEQCLFVARYTWEEENTNNVQFLQVTEEIDTTKTIVTQLWTTDLIIAKLIFDGTALHASSPFDYTRQSITFFSSGSALLPSFKVRSSEDPLQTNKVFVSSGFAATYKGIVYFPGGYSDEISDTISSGRADYIYINEDGEVKIQEGLPSATPEPLPFYDRTILALILRGPARTDIKGPDILDYRFATKSEKKSTSILVKPLTTNEYFDTDPDGFITMDSAIRQLHSERVTNSNDITTINNTTVFKAGTQTINGEKIFITLPKIESVGGVPLTPSDSSHVVPKQYYDEHTVKLTGVQEIADKKTFTTLPEVPEIDPTIDAQVVSLKFLIGNAKVLRLGTSSNNEAQTVYGIKTFDSAIRIPEPSVEEDAINKGWFDSITRDIVRKTDVDQNVNGIKTFLQLPEIPSTSATLDTHVMSKKSVNDNYVLKTGDVEENVNGIKKFNVMPKLQTSSGVLLSPTTNAHPVTLKYFTDNTVKLSGTQTISGAKTFSSSPKIPDSPADGNSAINKDYLDGSSSGVVHTTGTQTISGAKTFSEEVTALSFNATSSREKKEQIVPMKEKAIDIINNIEVVHFAYKVDKDKYKHTGFIAEDVDSLLNGKQGKTMAIADVVGVLLKAVQELSKENQELRNLINVK